MVQGALDNHYRRCGRATDQQGVGETQSHRRHSIRRSRENHRPDGFTDDSDRSQFQAYRHATSRNRPAMLLSLPSLAPEVPATIEFSPAGERHLRLVLAMSRLGMITDDDLAGLRRTRMNASAIRTLIERGWSREIGQDYDFKLISAFSRLILPDIQRSFIGSDEMPLVGFAINAAQPQWISIGKTFAAIESEAPGLGRAALQILNSALLPFRNAAYPGRGFRYGLASVLDGGGR